VCESRSLGVVRRIGGRFRADGAHIVKARSGKPDPHSRRELISLLGISGGQPMFAAGSVHCALSRHWRLRIVGFLLCPNNGHRLVAPLRSSGQRALEILRYQKPQEPIISSNAEQVLLTPSLCSSQTGRWLMRIMEFADPLFFSRPERFRRSAMGAGDGRPRDPAPLLEQLCRRLRNFVHDQSELAVLRLRPNALTMVAELTEQI